jgi:hypothetical protein
VVERKNRTVMEMTRALMKSMKVPRRFWAEAVRHSVYLLNRLPTKAMGYRTPYEAWNGRRPHLGHLKIFGCKGHVKTALPHLKKLEDRSMPMVYFGIEEGSKAHRMFNPQTNRIVVSRDVVFEETVMWSWDATDTEDFSVEMETGQFPSYVMTSGQGTWGGDGAHDDHQMDESETYSGGQHSVAGGRTESANTGSYSAPVQNPTTNLQVQSPQ